MLLKISFEYRTNFGINFSQCLQSLGTLMGLRWWLDVFLDIQEASAG